MASVGHALREWTRPAVPNLFGTRDMVGGAYNGFIACHQMQLVTCHSLMGFCYECRQLIYCGLCAVKPLC